MLANRQEELCRLWQGRGGGRPDVALLVVDSMVVLQETADVSFPSASWQVELYRV